MQNSENTNINVYKIEGEERTVKEFLRKDARLSSTYIKRIKFGGIYLNGECVTVRARVKGGDTLEIRDKSCLSSDIEPIEIPLSVIFEDDEVLAVSKPFGMPVHPSRGNHLPTLANAVMAYYKDIPFVFRAVNRLDRDTSGIVLIAKNAKAAYRLSEAMKAGEMEKEYVAILCAVPKDRKGVIKAPIRRECEGSIKRVVSDGGKDAITEYEVLSVSEDGTARIHLRPLTGRTHQIRVHMAHIGTPLLYDFLYGKGAEGEHYLLHAARLAFPHPVSGERITLISKPPF